MITGAKYGYADHNLLGLDYLLNTFVPRLKAEGLGDVVQQIFVDNPARAFSFAEPADSSRHSVAASLSATEGKDR